MRLLVSSKTKYKVMVVALRDFPVKVVETEWGCMALEFESRGVMLDWFDRIMKYLLQNKIYVDVINVKIQSCMVKGKLKTDKEPGLQGPYWKWVSQSYNNYIHRNVLNITEYVIDYI